MTTCERQAGFTLLELIVVLAVVGVLIGTAVPLAGAVMDADRRQEARRELADIATALDAYWFDHAGFPATLTATDFLGVYLQPGPMNTAVQDAFANQGYVYSLNPGTGVATVYSVGEDGVDSGAANEELIVHVYAAVPGIRHTWRKLRLIVEVLAEHIESGGSTSGSWPTVRAAAGLAARYDVDGFGTTLQWSSTGYTLTSAGPDRVFGTTDDISL